MMEIHIFGLLVVTNVALSLNVGPPTNDTAKPQRHPHAQGREFKGQFASNGAYKVHLTLLPPPVETVPDRAISGRQYIAYNKSEERDSNGYIRVQSIKPPYVSPYLIPVLIGTPGKAVHQHQSIANHKKQVDNRNPPSVSPPKEGNIPPGSVPDSRVKQVDDGSHKSKPALSSPYRTVPAAFEGQYVPVTIEQQSDDRSQMKVEMGTPRLIGTAKGPVPVGTGLEGQYVPVIIGKQYDDGAGNAKSRLIDTVKGPVPTGSDIEGQNIPDNLEKSFDDGSDKSSKPTPRTVNTLNGPVPAGSGAEGQYIPDNLEKLYDDGSDKSVKVTDSLNSVFDSEVNGEVVDENEKTFDDGLYKPKGLERSFDDGLYRPKNRETGFDDGLYRPEELAERFDDGLIK